MSYKNNFHIPFSFHIIIYQAKRFVNNTKEKSFLRVDNTWQKITAPLPMRVNSPIQKHVHFFLPCKQGGNLFRSIRYGGFIAAAIVPIKENGVLFFMSFALVNSSVATLR
jgi:hypothetical protein